MFRLALGMYNGGGIVGNDWVGGQSCGDGDGGSQCCGACRCGLNDPDEVVHPNIVVRDEEEHEW